MNLIYTLPSIVERIDLAKLFPSDQPLEVELGSGDGSFLAEYARLHPEHNFIGVERLLGRMRKLDRKGRRAGLTNLRGVRIESLLLSRIPAAAGLGGRAAHLLSRPVAEAEASPASADQRALSRAGPAGARAGRHGLSAHGR